MFISNLILNLNLRKMDDLDEIIGFMNDPAFKKSEFGQNVGKSRSPVWKPGLRKTLTGSENNPPIKIVNKWP